MRAIGIIFAALAGLAVAWPDQPSAAQSVAAQPAAGAAALRGAGSSFAAPLYKMWIGAWEKTAPALPVVYESVGSGEGVSRFLADKVDFGATDRPLTEAEVQKAVRGVVVVPSTAGMVVVAHSLKGVGDLKLPRDVYVDIFAGRITSWADPRIQAANPGSALPRRNIALVGRQDSSGTTFAFTSHLAAVSADWKAGPGVGARVTWPSNALLARGNEGVAHMIKISEGAIGYVEYGFAKRLGLHFAALQNKAGNFVAPGEAGAQTALAEAGADPRLAITDPVSGSAYPIVTYSWLLLHGSYPDAARGAAVKAFVGWGLGEGRTAGTELGYVALPESVASRSRAALASIR